MTSQSTDDLVRRLCEETDALYKAAELARTKTNRATTATIERLQRELAAKGGQQRKCAALVPTDPPQDCDAPFCGCNPEWTKTIEALQECGWGPLAARDKTIEALREKLNQRRCEHRFMMNTGMDEATSKAQTCERCGIAFGDLCAIDAARKEASKSVPDETLSAARSEGGSHE